MKFTKKGIIWLYNLGVYLQDKFKDQVFELSNYMFPTPYIIIVNFTINSIKYQTSFSGNYIEIYKKKDEADKAIMHEDAIKTIILQSKKNWVKKSSSE